MTRKVILAAVIVTVAGLGITAASAAWAARGQGAATAKSTTLPTGPATTAPVTSSQTTTGITVTWQRADFPNTTDEVAGYTVTRLKGGVADTVAGTCTGTIAAPTRTCTDTVTSGGVYTYRITAVSGPWVTGTAGPASGAVTVTLIPPAPTNLTITACTYNKNTNTASVTFTWTASTGAATSQLLYRGSTAATVTTVQHTINDNTTVTSTESVTGLANGASQFFAISAKNSAGESGKTASNKSITVSNAGSPGTCTLS